MSKRVVIISVSTIVLIAAALVWMVVSGRLLVAWKSPHEQIATDTRVCGASVIEKYNSSFTAESQGEYKQRLKDAHDMVAELNDADQDPNCVFIRFSYNLENNDIEKARADTALLKSLAGEGKYATAELDNAQSVASIERMLDALEEGESFEDTPSTESADPGRG